MPEGMCVIGQTDDNLAITEPASILKDLNLRAQLIETDEWGAVAFSEVVTDVFALWACTGEVAAVAVRDIDGSFQRVDVGEYRNALDLNALRESQKTQ